jgi:hypothetical protein
MKTTTITLSFLRAIANLLSQANVKFTLEFENTVLSSSVKPFPKPLPKKSSKVELKTKLNSLKAPTRFPESSLVELQVKTKRPADAKYDNEGIMAKISKMGIGEVMLLGVPKGRSQPLFASAVHNAAEWFYGVKRVYSVSQHMQGFNKVVKVTRKL